MTGKGAGAWRPKTERSFANDWWVDTGQVPRVVGSFVILAAYCGFYVAYYLGITRWAVLLGMALFPPMAYLLAALYQGNVLAALATVIFGATHVALTYRNLGSADQRHPGDTC